MGLVITGCDTTERTQLPVTIDTVRLFIPGPLDAPLQDVLDDCQEVYRNGALHSVTGTLGSLRVCTFEAGTSVSGSFPRFLHGANTVPLSLDGAEQLLGMIADGLRLPSDRVRHAQVTRLDLAADLVLPRPPIEYTQALIEVPRTNALRLGPASVLFKTTQRELAFYDKGAEVQAKGGVLPALLQGRHVLRYELRLKQKLTKHYGQQVRAEDLAAPAFMEKAAMDWADRGASVRFTALGAGLDVSTVHALRESLAAQALIVPGKEQDVLHQISHAAATGDISRQQASRLRMSVRALSDAATLSHQGSHQDEYLVALARAVEATLGRLSTPSHLGAAPSR